ncbi:P-loop containing nucleoside triphosphate hydrolase protein [Scenedesmus sp. NREL 46B-D3]|nr:P-loop containing nucleoside triphosphate hydrolase protein [Scenedesmus sp. NREL 46B-D3]
MGQNQFASGGLVLMAVGAAAAGARLALSSALRYCRRHVMVTAEIDSRDDAYRWRDTNLAGTFGTSVVQHPLASSSSSSSSSKGGEGPPVAYLPAPGDHLLRYRGKWMCISRRRAAGNPQLAANARLLLETLRISLLGTDRQPLDALLAEAAAAFHQSQATRTAVHSVDQDGYWSQADSLLTDCQEFLASEEWYAHHGIPYRRGYLLYGPPGTGKTSLVMALAGALGLEIYVVTLSSPTMTDETLRNLLNTAGVRSILLLEDVDAAFVDRSAAGGGGAARLTFSGLLNAIDGVAAQEGRLLFMTTNHIERLAGALIRPGRVDVRCFLGPATQRQARNLFVSFYRDLPHLLLQPHSDLAAAAGVTGDEPPMPRSQGTTAESAAAAEKAAGAAGAMSVAQREAVLVDLAQQFAVQLPAEGGVSMAQLQGFLMTHRKDPWAAVTSVGTLLQQARQQQQQQQPEQ